MLIASTIMTTIEAMVWEQMKACQRLIQDAKRVCKKELLNFEIVERTPRCVSKMKATPKFFRG